MTTKGPASRAARRAIDRPSAPSDNLLRMGSRGRHESLQRVDAAGGAIEMSRLADYIDVLREAANDNIPGDGAKML